jgi:hypothetical protein
MGFICGRLPYHDEDSVLFFDRLDPTARLLEKIFEKHLLRRVSFTIDGRKSYYLVLSDLTTDNFIEDPNIDNILDILMPDIKYLRKNNIEFYNGGKSLFNIIQNREVPLNPRIAGGNIMQEDRIRVSGNINSIGNVGNHHRPRSTITWPHVS